MTDTNSEVLVCDASIMKNVWEIRHREHGQKMKSEEERLEKSALMRINEDWAKRMSGKVKPRRAERKDKPIEELPAQTYKAKQMALGRPSGFVSSRPQRPVDVKKVETKRNKLALLLSLSEKQPGLMVWTKSWKFTQTLSQPEQIPPASNWGQSWKFFNVQPNNEGKSWQEHVHDTNNEYTYNGVLFPWTRVNKPLTFEKHKTIPDWENCWKYTNQKKEAHGSGSNGPKNLRQEKLNMLHQINGYNEDYSSYEWHESWKTAKPSKEDNVKFVCESLSSESDVDNEEQSTIPWSLSWKHFKRQLHMKPKSLGTSSPPGWMDSWRLSKPFSQISQQQNLSIISEPPIKMPEEPLDPKTYKTIIDASKDENYRMLGSSHFQENNVPLGSPEWQKSWVTIKNLSAYEERPVEKLRENKTKLPEQKQVWFDGLPVKHEFEVFPFPKKGKPEEILECSAHQDEYTFISKWKDSWKSLKNQRRQTKIQRRRQRMSALKQAPQTSLTEWTNSWKFTNLNLNQESNLWQKGWSAFTKNRTDRWVRANESINEEFPCNGPAGSRGWGESWRSTRHQHRVEREGTHSTRPSTQIADTQLHRRERSLADWEQSWQLSTNQFLQDGPSTTEWAGSWSFSRLHCENRVDHPPDASWLESSMEIKVGKELHSPLHRLSRSFQPHTFKERFPAHEWKKSWKIKTSDEKEQPKPGQKEFSQSWHDSSMFSATLLYKSERTESNHSHSLASAQYQSVSEWGTLWKIANPQPPKGIMLWSEAQPNTCSPQHMVFFSRNKCNNYLFSLLAKACASVRKWGMAWRFMKLESKLDMKSVMSQLKYEDEFVIFCKKMTKKHMFSQINKEGSQRRWADACKLAKTQPRPKRDARCKPGQGKDEGDKVMFAEWACSWRFVTESVSVEPVKMPVCLSDWENSWKFLLNPYEPHNGPKKTKGRS